MNSLKLRLLKNPINGLRASAIGFLIGSIAVWDIVNS